MGALYIAPPRFIPALGPTSPRGAPLSVRVPPLTSGTLAGWVVGPTCRWAVGVGGGGDLTLGGGGEREAVGPGPTELWMSATWGGVWWWAPRRITGEITGFRALGVYSVCVVF